MKKINFERFEIYTNVTMQNCITRDIREDFADTIMQNLNRGAWICAYDEGVPKQWRDGIL